MNKDLHSDTDLKRIFSFKNIAVVGMSKNAEKAANYVPKYLIEHGYHVIPVNPTTDEIMGLRSYSRVSDIREQVDILDVFRPSEAVADVVSDAINKQGLKVVWMQEGIYNQEAEKMAKEKSIDVVFNRCMMAEHMRLFGE
jgi:predicted CoA-binding protein